MRSNPLLLLAALIASCGRSQDADNSTVEPARQPADMRIEPGMWEFTVQIGSMEMSEASEEAKAEMREMMRQPQTSSECITPQQAANPIELLIDRRDCRLSESVFSNGTIRVNGSCGEPSGDTEQFSADGRYTARSLRARISVQAQLQPTISPIRPESARASTIISGRRTGDCPAG